MLFSNITKISAQLFLNEEKNSFNEKSYVLNEIKKVLVKIQEKKTSKIFNKSFSITEFEQ